MRMKTSPNNIYKCFLQLWYWDIRASNLPAAISGIHTTFHDTPSGCLRIQSRTGFDCFAASGDGQVSCFKYSVI